MYCVSFSFARTRWEQNTIVCKQIYSPHSTRLVEIYVTNANQNSILVLVKRKYICLLPIVLDIVWTENCRTMIQAFIIALVAVTVAKANLFPDDALAALNYTGYLKVDYIPAEYAVPEAAVCAPFTPL